MHYTSKEVYEHISKQTNDPIVERKTCRVSGKEFAVYQSDVEFFERLSPVVGGKKYMVPTPTLCPEERQRRRMAWRNDNVYFKRTCDFSGQSIVTTYHPDVPGPVYKVKHRRSDAWDGVSYGQSIDWDRSFMDQWHDLWCRVPKIAMMNDNDMVSENIEYCQNLSYSKDCYLTTVSRKLSNCYYSCNMATGDRLVDSYFTMDSEVCYECVESHKLSHCFYLMNCHDCVQCWFGYELHGCRNCLFSVGLVNKQYCVFNEQVTKEVYEQKLNEMKAQLLKDPESVYALREEYLGRFPRKDMNLVETEKTFGNNIMNAESVTFCYNIKNVKNCKYFMFADTGVDGVDLTVGGELELCYEGITPDHCYQAGRTNYCWKSKRIWYSEMCHGCSDCFGCIGLKNKQYCIFNKQYTKEEYEKYIPQLIEKMQGEGLWGEFFPLEYSPFAYNETVAMDYFPEQSGTQPYTRRDEKPQSGAPDPAFLCEGRDLCRNPHEVRDDITKYVIACCVSGKYFRIMPQELAFYKKHDLPLPTKHPLIRYRERLKRMPDKRLYCRVCDETGEQLISVHPQTAQYDVLGSEVFTKKMFG